MLRPSLFVVVAAATAGCTPPAGQVCGLSVAPPAPDEVNDGRGTAVRSDGVPFDVEGDWAPAPSSSLVLGTLTMGMQFDETGTAVDDLIADGAFPICVPQGERGDKSGAANLLDGGFVTDATRNGGLAILGKEADLLLGRFAFTLIDPSGVELTFSDGAFRVPQR
ncbi:MAG: hypothetical protein FJ137_16335 [Deltaproteobacteria bacterium]|nr:hypothetical protein [Deltaproteobacteria bacterium]